MPVNIFKSRTYTLSGSLNPLTYDRIWFSISLLLNLAFLIVVFSLLGGTHISRYYFNSDMMYDPMIYRDIFMDKSGLAGWYFNPAPNFFPDMLLYFFYMFLFKGNLIIANFAFSIIQYFSVLFLFYLLLRQTNRETSLLYASIFNLLFLFFLLIPVISLRFQIAFHIISISYHIGSFVLFLVSINLLLYYIKHPKMPVLVLLFIITTLGVFNDRLFISQYYFAVLPLAVLMIRRDHYKRLLKPLLFSLAALLFGLFLFGMLQSSHTLHTIDIGSGIIQPGDVGKAWNYFLGYLRSDFLARFPEVIIFTLSLLSVVAAYIFIIVRRKSVFKGQSNRTEQACYYLVIILAIYIPVTLLTPVFTGAFKAPSITRYNVMAFYAGLFLPVVLMQVFRDSRLSTIRISRMLVPFLSLLFFFFLARHLVRNDVKEGIKGYFNYYPELVQQLDELKEENELKYGIGNYWYSKYSMMLSRNDLRVYPVFGSTLRPYYHCVNENWYYSGGKGKHKDPVFNFTIRKTDVPSDVLLETFGTRMDTLYVDPGKVFVVIKTPAFTIDRDTRNIRIIDP